MTIQCSIMMEEYSVAPVRSKSFPLQERSTWKRLEEEQFCQQWKAMENPCDKVKEEQKLMAQEEEKQTVQEEERRQEAQKSLLAQLARGEELILQLHEQADAHEEEKKKSAKELKVGITKSH